MTLDLTCSIANITGTIDGAVSAGRRVMIGGYLSKDQEHALKKKVSSKIRHRSPHCDSCISNKRGSTIKWQNHKTWQN